MLVQLQPSASSGVAVKTEHPHFAVLERTPRSLPTAEGIRRRFDVLAVTACDNLKIRHMSPLSGASGAVFKRGRLRINLGRGGDLISRTSSMRNR